MTKEELCKQYADKKTLDCHNSRFGINDHVLHVKKSYDLFTGYDIEQAYEDGFDKAVDLACAWLVHNGKKDFLTMPSAISPDYNIKLFVSHFRKAMEEGV